MMQAVYTGQIGGKDGICPCLVSAMFAMAYVTDPEIWPQFWNAVRTLYPEQIAATSEQARTTMTSDIIHINAVHSGQK